MWNEEVDPFGNGRFVGSAEVVSLASQMEASLAIAERSKNGDDFLRSESGYKSC